MSLVIEARKSGFGAQIYGVDLTRPVDQKTEQAIRETWLYHQVVCFPDQDLTVDEFERAASLFGEFGVNRYLEGIPGHPNVIEVRRGASERVAPFGASWHSDWSFEERPPSATLLHAKVVPPTGGATHFADGRAAYATLDDDLRARIDGLTAIHSARRSYSLDGYHRGGGPERSMRIVPNDSAYATQSHPLVRTHPETGTRALWVNPVYTIGIEGMEQAAAEELLLTLYEHALQSRFIYRHVWEPHTLVVWDNRSVQHCAQGGYDGYERIMHRIIIAGERPI